MINSGRFGNGTAIFTNDGGAARRFQNEVQVGMIGINVPIPVPVAYHSFGGWKASLFGDAKAYGVHGFDFFTREKAITSRWLDPTRTAASTSVSPRTTDVRAPLKGVPMSTPDARWFHRRSELARDGWESVVDATTPGWRAHRHPRRRARRRRSSSISAVPAWSGSSSRSRAPSRCRTHDGRATATRVARARRPCSADRRTCCTCRRGAPPAHRRRAGRGGRPRPPTRSCRRRYIPAGDTPVELRGAGASEPSGAQLRNAAGARRRPAHRVRGDHARRRTGLRTRRTSTTSVCRVTSRGSRRSTTSRPRPIAGSTAAAGNAFGMFSTYSSPAGEIEINARVRTGDIALVPFGYHGPAVAAPGYDLYYLNVMAGPDPRARVADQRRPGARMGP